MTGKRGRKRLWRWRSSPLRRHDDKVEAWIVLAMWMVIAVGGAIVGLVTAHACDNVLTRQRAERHSSSALLLTDVPGTASAGASSDRALAKVRWTLPDGTARTGRTLVDTGQKAGAHVVVWLDAKGGLTTEPPGPVEAGFEAALMGMAAALALAGGVYGVGAAARWRLDRRRIDAWGREWEQIGPRWCHRTG
ncbi:hypothetical protein ACI2L1_35705 [Streptomyces sp. NPDC019531]|uniref:Rv1733c family protein n=1 Tax=Streptomyces sp. NPDC019531 TaxID=3365062 RepID=UPI00384F532E